jgi:hypothetical protein
MVSEKNLFLSATIAMALIFPACNLGVHPTTSTTQSGSGVSPGGAGGSGTSGSGTTSSQAAQVNPVSVAANFPSTWYFNQSVANSAVDDNSKTIIAQLDTNGGWGNGNTFQMDLSIGAIFVNLAQSSVPASSTDTSTTGTIYVPFNSSGTGQPDSDIPTSVPTTASLPITSEGSGFESSEGQTFDGGDSHYIVFDAATKLLTEVYQANISGGVFSAAGIIIWDPKINYPANLRGDVCTSADASGGLMGPLLTTPDEVAAGEITHALRLILPNSRIQYKQYVRPATHGTGGTGWATTNGVPYGARFRLKPNVTLPNPSPAALVFLTALKTYGMILSDGGNIALSVANDSTFTNKWADILPNGTHELYGLTPDDFEMISVGGNYINFTSYDCVRTPISLIPGTTP